MIAVVDYNMGNLRSVEKALQIVGGRAKVTANPRDIARASKIVFPGVGSFGEAMKELRRLRLISPLKDAVAAGKPFLGLCLGLQLLFGSSQEAPGVKGLGIFPGAVRRFRLPKGFKVPHMGWNSVAGARGKRQGAGVIKGVKDGSYMYFVHSYYVVPEDKDVILTTTEYGINFVSGVAKGNIVGLQFHPEKSQALGLRILKNFVKL